MGDQIVGAVEIEPADLTDPRRNQQVRRITGEPRAGDAVLHDVEGIDHHRRDAGASATAEKLALHGTLGREEFAKAAPRRGNLDGGLRRSRSCAMGVDRHGVRKHVAREIGGDDDFRSECARRRDGHRIDQGAVDQPAIADQDRRKYPGQRVGRPHRIDHAAMGQPDLMAGADFCRDGGKLQRQVFDMGPAEGRFELRGELVAADQAGSIEANVEIAEDIARLQAACPFLQRVEMPGGVGTADHRTDRGADHDIGNNAMGDQRPDNADMGKSTRGAAAERQPDHRTPDAAEPDLVQAGRAVLAPPYQVLQHKPAPSARQIGPIRSGRRDGYPSHRAKQDRPEIQYESQLHHTHGSCRYRVAVGGNYDWMATPVAVQSLLRGFGASIGQPSGERLEFASFSVKSMAHDFEGPR